MSDSSPPIPPVPVKCEYPEALTSPITLGGPNEPIHLYSGAIDFAQGATTFRARANICLEWLPFPQISFNIPEVPADVYPDLGEVSLRLDDGADIQRAFISGSNQSNGPEGYKSQFSGIIGQRVIRPKDDAASYALFVLPNFDAPRGQAVALPANGWRAARLSFQGEGWKITLDDVHQAKDINSTARF